MFFGLDWISALIKISFEVVFAIVTAIPLYFAWNGVASTYFYFLPEIWLDIPYWSMVGLLLCSTYIGQIVNRITPKFIEINNTNKE